MIIVKNPEIFALFAINKNCIKLMLRTQNSFKNQKNIFKKSQLIAKPVFPISIAKFRLLCKELKNCQIVQGKNQNQQRPNLINKILIKQVRHQIHYVKLISCKKILKLKSTKVFHNQIQLKQIINEMQMNQIVQQLPKMINHDQKNYMKRDINQIALFLKLTVYESNKYEEARKLFDISANIDSSDKLNFHMSGCCLTLLEKHNEALECFEKALLLDPKFSLSLHGKGDSLRKINRETESLIFYQKALEIDPKLKNSLYGKGAALYQLTKFEESIIFLEKCLVIDPNFWQAQYVYGLCLRSQEKYKDAIFKFEKSLEINPNHEDSIQYKKECQQKIGIK